MYLDFAAALILIICIIRGEKKGKKTANSRESQIKNNTVSDENNSTKKE